MKRKAGRPKLPKGKAKGKIVPIRVSKAEADQLPNDQQENVFTVKASDG